MSMQFYRCLSYCIVNHQILLSKLQYYSLGEQPYLGFYSNLVKAGRAEFVCHIVMNLRRTFGTHTTDCDSSSTACVGSLLDRRRLWADIWPFKGLTRMAHSGSGFLDTTSFSFQWKSIVRIYRRQYFMVNGVPSEPPTMTHGVPNGSILGLLLFLVFINDIPNSSRFFKSIILTNDSTLSTFLRNPSPELFARTINVELT